MMSKKIIMVTGGSGLVGQAIQKVIKEEDPVDEYWIFLSSKDADLLDTQATNNIFDKYKPTHVIHLAAIAEGIYSNIGQNLNKMRMNRSIDDNVLEATRHHKCHKVVSCLSPAIYPADSEYPIDETMLHDGPPHHSLAGYAYAKRTMEITNHYYYKEHGIQATSVIPTNIYGPNDNFNLKNCRVVAGLIHKCFLAQKENKAFVISGTGKPRRQFIHAEDFARLIVWTLREYPEINPIILSVSEDEEISIKELGEIIAEALEFKGEIVFDTSQMDGALKKTSSNNKMRSYLPDYKFKPLKEGIQETVDWFKENKLKFIDA